MARGGPRKIFFDGACRPNPGRIDVAVVARGQVLFFDELGEGSSSDAEWLALRHGLAVAQQLGVAEFDLLGDSLSIVQQATGRVPCRDDAARSHYEAVRALMASAMPRRIRWVPRRQNLAGIALDRRHARAGVASPPRGLDLLPSPL